MFSLKSLQKLNLSHVLSIIIALTIIYLLFRLYEEKYVIDHFDSLQSSNDSNRSSSTEYKENTESNNNSTNSSTDVWTGIWLNYQNNDEVTSTQYQLVLRKLEDRMLIAMSKRSINDNTNKDNVTTTTPKNMYPNYMFVAIGEIDKNDITKVHIHEIKQNKIGITTALPYLKYNTSSNSLEFHPNRSSSISFHYFTKYSLPSSFLSSPALVSFFKTPPPLLTDIGCATGKKKCKVSSSGAQSTIYDGCASPTNIDTNGNCTYTAPNASTDVCYLTNQANPQPFQVNQNISIQPCNPNFHVLQSSIGYMMNNLFTTSTNTNDIITCPYISKLTGFSSYLILYFYDSKNFLSLGFQQSGIKTNENLVIAQTTSLNQALSFNSSIITKLQVALQDSTNPEKQEISSSVPPTLWTTKRGYSQNSCYVTIETNSAQNKYYLNYNQSNHVYLSPLSSGTQRLFTLTHQSTIDDSSNDYVIYTGYLKNPDGKYLSVGGLDNQTLTPMYPNNINQVCTLKDNFDKKGVWMVVGMNGTINEFIQKVK